MSATPETSDTLRVFAGTIRSGMNKIWLGASLYDDVEVSFDVKRPFASKGDAYVVIFTHGEESTSVFAQWNPSILISGLRTKSNELVLGGNRQNRGQQGWSCTHRIIAGSMPSSTPLGSLTWDISNYLSQSRFGQYYLNWYNLPVDDNDYTEIGPVTITNPDGTIRDVLKPLKSQEGLYSTATKKIYKFRSDYPPVIPA